MAYDNVDKRVVKFEFDNSQFDKKVKQSVKSINKLDETLQFKDVSKSLDKVKVKFSAFEIAAVSMISNISNRIIDVGIRLVKSLSIDNITAGWEKFGQKTVSVGTLMAQSLKVAGKEIEDYAEKMEIVNEQLDKLNWFTDETSYNFTDMVDNIGKFTAAGVDLDAAVEAMMGIANWAALSGQNAATASRAMYQLAQSLGKGYVQLIDYKSIQNANMDTQEFRQTVLDTAVAMGELTKQGENYITKAGSKFNKNQFTEQLTAKWFTSGVLTKSLEKYSAAVEDLYEITEREGITASEAIEQYSDQFDEFAIKAFKAAQEARTFSDAINSVKDAVSTGWMTTAENIFGDYDTAKVFWTDIANELYDVFAAGAAYRNQMLKLWADMEGRADLFAHTGDDDQGAFWNIYDAILAVKNTFSSAWDAVFPKSTFENAEEQADDLGYRLKLLTSTWQKLTLQIKKNVTENQNVKSILTGLYTVLKVVLATIQSIIYAFDPIIYSFKQVLATVMDFAGYLGKTLTESTSFVNTMFTIAEKINSALTTVFTMINPNGILKSLFNFIKQIFNLIKNLIEGIRTGLEETLGFVPKVKTLENTIVNFATNIFNIISKVINFLVNSVVPIISEVFKTIGKVIGVLAGTIKNLIKILANASGEIINFFKENELITNILNGITKAVGWFVDKMRSLVAVIRDIANTKGNKSLSDLLPFANKGEKQKKSLKDFYNDIVSSTSIVSSIINVLKALKNIIIAAAGLLKSVLEIAAAALNSISGYINTITKFLNNLAKGAEEAKEQLKNILLITATILVLSQLVKVFINLKWMVEFAKANIFGVLDSFADAAIKSSWAKIIKSFGTVILDVGVALLSVAVSMTIFEKISPEGFKRGITVLSILAVLLIALSALAKRLSKGINGVIPGLKKLGSDSTKLEANIQRSNLTELSWLLISFSVSMLMIAKSFKTFDKISPETWQKSGKVMAIMGVALLALVAVCNIISTKKGDTKAAFPGITTFIGLALAIKAMSNALYKMFTLDIIKNGELSKAAKQMLYIFAGIAGVLTILSGIIKIITTKMSISAKAVAKEGRSISVLGNFRLNPIAQIITSISLFLLSLTVSIKILEKVIWISGSLKDILDKASKFMITIISIVAGLEIILKIMDVINNSIISKSKNEGFKGVTSSKGSPISKILVSLSVFILTITGSLFILEKVVDNADPNKLDKVRNILYVVMGSILAFILLLSLILKDSAYEKVGEKTASEGTRVTATKSAVSSILYAMTALILAVTASITVLAVLPISESRFDKAMKTIVLTIGLIGAIILAVSLINIGNKNETGKGLKPLLKFALGFVLVSASLIAMFFALEKISEIIQKLPDGTLIKIGVIAAVFVALGAIVGAIPAIATGMLSMSASFLLLGIGLMALGKGMEMFMPSLDKIRAMDTKDFIALIKFLGLLDLMGTVGIIAAVALPLLGVGMIALGEGISRLCESSGALANINIENFNKILGRIVAWGTLGLIAAVTLPLLGLGLMALGDGITRLCESSGALDDINIENFNKIMGRLMAWGSLGIVAAVTLPLLGLGMMAISSSLKPFAEGLKALEGAPVKTFNQIMGRLVAWGTLSVIAIGTLPLMAATFVTFAATLDPFGNALRKIDGAPVKTFNQIMGILVKWGSAGIISGIGLKQLADATRNFSETLIPFSDALTYIGNKQNKKSFEPLTALFSTLISYGKKAFGSANRILKLSESIQILSTGINIVFNSIKYNSYINMDALGNLLDVLINYGKESVGIGNKLTKLSRGIINFSKSIASLFTDMNSWITINGNENLASLFAVLNSIDKEKGKEIKNSLAKIATGINNLKTAIQKFSGQSMDILKYISDIVNYGLGDKDIVIDPKMDLKHVKSGINELNELLDQIRTPVLTMGAVDAAVAQSKANEASANQTTNNTTNYYNTFNITSTNPTETAEEIDRKLQKQKQNNKLAYGGV